MLAFYFLVSKLIIYKNNLDNYLVNSVRLLLQSVICVFLNPFF